MNNINEKELYQRLTKALNALEKARQKIHTLETQQKDPIAIIGIACQLPGNINDPEAFWNSLAGQQDQVSRLPDKRWSIEKYVNSSPQQPGKMISDQGGFMQNHPLFDAQFFGISPREAIAMDPQQRLILKTAWRTLENAGIPPDTLKGSDTGVFIGVTNTDYGHAQLKSGDSRQIDAYSATGTALNVISGRLSYFLDLNGPSITMDTACSSSLVALHQACLSLRQQECTLALCAGVNVILLPEGNIALSQANMLSPDGRCYTFDQRANGYVRGEGCVSLLLKKYSDAHKDGDKIYALIQGSAINHGGKSSGLTVPNAKAQAKLIRQALKNAHLNEYDIDYIETHGTGTALGDPIEVNALNEVFAETKRTNKPLLLGSVKTNFGHLESASGLLGLLKVIMAMQHEVIPATKHFETINPLINLETIPSTIVVKNTPWTGKKVAGVSSFGFSGINAHAIVTSVDQHVLKREGQNPSDRNYHLISCSAKDSNALRTIEEQLKQFILNNKQASLADIAYSYNVCRNQFPLRQAFVAQNKEELLDKLNKAASKSIEESEHSNQRKRIAFLFSGQGSQYAGMGKNLYQSAPLFKTLIDEGCERINKDLGYRLQDLMFSTSDERLNQTINTQPILFIFNYALAKLWESWGIHADCYIGHSISEYLAATLAGVMEFDEALSLVYERARLMQSLPAGGSMMLVMASKEELAPILHASHVTVDIAIITNDYTVLSGDKEELESLTKEWHWMSKMLDVSHAFHSSLMNPIVQEFKEFASRIQYKAPRKNVISNVSGELYEKDTVNAEYWAQHLRQAVDLRKSMTTLAAQQYDILLEIGPRPTFSKSAVQFAQLKWVYSLRREVDDWHSLLMNLAELYESGITVNWQELDAGYSRHKITIPGYPFQEKEYWGLAQEEQTPISNALYAVENLAQALTAVEKTSLQEPLLLITTNKTLIKAFQESHLDISLCSDRDALQNLLTQRPFSQVVFALQAKTKDMAKAVSEEYQFFLELLQQLLKISTKQVKLWLLTSSADSSKGLAQSPLLGLRKCLLLESALIDCTHLEVDKEKWDEETAQQLIDEMQHPNEEKQVFYQAHQRFVPRLKPFSAEIQHTNLIKQDACYLITGGQGALAAQVVEWYITQGAQHLLLLSRSAPSNATQQRIATAATQGCRIECLAMDVSDKKALNRLFAEFGQSRPALKGIIHAAGVLDDGLIQQQNMARFRGLLKAKIEGAWYLHELSLGHDLNHFILFSSMASLLGTPGQSNYAAANAFLDRLATYRITQHLPALSINWGPWADVGMAKDIQSRAQGLNKLNPQQGMQLFDQLMHSDCPSQVMAASIDWEKATHFHTVKIPLLEHFMTNKASIPEQETTAILDVVSLQKMPREEVKEHVMDQLQRQFQHILRLDRLLHPNENFFELGMDSLMAIELRNNLQSLLGNTVSLSQTVLFELATLNDLAEYLVSLIQQASAGRIADDLLSHEEQLLAKLDELSEDDIDLLLQEAMNNDH